MKTKEHTSAGATYAVESILLKTKDACRLLSIHPRTLRRMEKAGLIRPVHLLRHKLYVREDIERLVEGLRSWKP